MEESINANTPADDDSLPSVVRGNRTKRQRLQLPPLTVLAGGQIRVSSTSSAQFSGRNTTTADDDEEEDIANCLILLAMGRALETPIRKPESKIAVEEAEPAVKLAASAAANGKTGFYVYECKTCNKCFPSFQALGGHRVSHKKPKLSISSPSPTAKPPAVNSTGAVEEPTDSAAAGGGKGRRRIHACSTCGVQFTSGQALGGHMRRHRPASHQEPAKKEKNGLSVDLNLPAPSDEDHRSFPASSKSSSDSTAVFSFATKAPLLLLPPALVDCHY